MKKLLALTLSALGSTAMAQTPAVNLMPDGSRDMYVGLGAVVQPRYEGSEHYRTRALPLLQVELSNGLFLSGLSAGWHLSQQPALEFGPLLTVHPGRHYSGSGPVLGGVNNSLAPAGAMGNRRLAGMDDIDARLTGGVFLNYDLNPRLRLTNTVLYGAGGDGLSWELGVQQLATDMQSRHRVSLTGGLTVVNRDYNSTFFGVDRDAALATGMRPYQADGGVKDVFLRARWNWALSPSWILSSSARVSRLTGDARRSPLVERPTQFSISTGLAYRF
jgi:outer membrane scaffolding protein for murein synthesis (MipA/OmpV family)